MHADIMHEIASLSYRYADACHEARARWREHSEADRARVAANGVRDDLQRSLGDKLYAAGYNADGGEPVLYIMGDRAYWATKDYGHIILKSAVIRAEGRRPEDLPITPEPSPAKEIES